VLLIEKIGVSPKAKLAAAGIQAIDSHAGKAVDAALAEVFASMNAPSNV
jgi:lactoylglutathione lyase